MAELRVQVSAEELRRLWMSRDAVGMTDDLQTRTRVITMLNGTEYETPFDELGALS